MFVLTYQVTPCRVTSSYVTSSYVMSCYVVQCRGKWHVVTQMCVISHQVTPFRVTACYVMVTAYDTSIHSSIGSYILISFVCTLDGKAPTILTSNKTITKTNQVSYIVTKVGGVINTLLSANVEIKCEASGFPPPNVVWYKDDKVVRKDSTILVNKKGTLMFVSIALRRAGIYKCVANNPLGSALAFTALNVNGKDVVIFVSIIIIILSLLSS